MKKSSNGRHMKNSTKGHKTLWAPWRIEYITGKKKKGCIFCSALKAQNDKESLVLFRSQYAFVIMNAYPYNNGHLMVVPNRHISDMSILREPEVTDMFDLTVYMQKILKQTIKPQGFNIGLNSGSVAGAGINDHIHVHIVPRWNGDTNFMPVISDTKVISQSLEDLYEQLSAVITGGIRKARR